MRAMALVVIATLAACGRMINHDEHAAAREAEEFGRLAFVAKDFASAYQHLTAQARSSSSLAEVSTLIDQMHKDGYPESIRATQFEPMPGQASMLIFLIGENGSSKFYYRFALVGTASEGYHVGGLWRGSGPYPTSPTRRDL